MATSHLHPPKIHIDLPLDSIAALCERWHISEFALFGSVLRDDFNDQSDVNVMVSFEPASHIGLLDIARIEEELAGIFHRNVMVLTRRGVEMGRNPGRRKEILQSAEVIYARR